MPATRLRFFMVGEDGKRLASPEPERLEAISDAAGAFRLALVPGRYQVEGSSSAATLGDTEVGIPRQGTLVLELEPRARVEGRVRDHGGRPVEGAEVRAVATETVAANSGRGGEFAVAVPGARVALWARSGPLAGALTWVEARPGETVRDVELVLGEGPVLEGSVAMIGSGEPVPSAAVRATFGPAGGGPTPRGSSG